MEETLVIDYLFLVRVSLPSIFVLTLDHPFFLEYRRGINTTTHYCHWRGLENWVETFDQYILIYILSKDIYFNLIIHAPTSAETLTTLFFSIRIYFLSHYIVNFNIIMLRKTTQLVAAFIANKIITNHY